MKVIKMRKSVFIGTIVSACLIFGAVGAGAATGLQKITANLNHNIKFKIDGDSWTPKNDKGQKMPPITYQGSTYLPARAVAEATGMYVGWDDATDTVIINTDGSAPVQEEEEETEAPVSSAGIMKLTGTEAQMEDKLRAEAQKIIKIYADALLTEDTSKFDAYIDSYTAEKRDNSPISLGRQYYKDDFSEMLAGTIEANTAADTKEYANTLKGVTLSEIETSYISDKSEFGQYFEFVYYPEGWDAFSSVYVKFEFSAEYYDSSTYLLEEVSVN
ncbi:copper amine oxidase N-terminal domain-containing protein [Paenibacillus soyae]|uniref:Copper amine oxidase N-terminal domain-containing protein n=1 Tax=Paenibacillus soyae TaxID=2969249 RepID=A0A9X2MTF5_9BACL|nr:copper amine oxidase N-terminal domain-containing protein [Paenibacillus soyae]MCR2803412.1 copper amine oxidase N-terminal domain-containing protein [Paenibacillus soyae]